MIAMGLKQLAKENGLYADKGVAFGNLKGYAATLSEGAGYKLLQIATVFQDPQGQFHLDTTLNSRDLMKEFRVKQLLFMEKGIKVVFHDNPGTMKLIYAFIEWFFPLLEEYGASKWNVCVECGEEIAAGQWKLIDGMAFYFHTNCAQTVETVMKREKEVRKEEKGSYGSGLVGAFLGAALGAVVWALVLFCGYVASIVGFLIGWLAEKGYHLLHGKNGKGKIAILIGAVIFGVLLGIFLGEALSVVSLIQNGELPGWNYSDIPYIFALLLMDMEYVANVGMNVLIGLVFAGIGIFSLIKRANDEVSDVKIEDLNEKTLN